MRRQENQEATDLAALWREDWDHPGLAAQLSTTTWAWQFLRRNEEYTGRLASRSGPRTSRFHLGGGLHS